MPYEIFLECGHNEIVMTASWFLRRRGNEWNKINRTKFCKECNDYCRIIKVVKRLWFERRGLSASYRQD